MAVIGIGTDLVAIARFRRLVDRYGDRLVARLLHDREAVDYSRCYDRSIFLAKRFAVKEAAAKALGTGFSGGVRYAEIAVDHDRAGKPLLIFEGQALNRARAMGAVGWHVSISDERQYALAFVILES